MVKKREKLFSKIVVITILALVAIGFTIPGFVEFDGEDGKIVEPRICQNDADCYLMCDEVPLAVLCYQNLCQQNSCEEDSYYPFVEEPISFKLEIIKNGEIMDLEKNASQKNIFVKFEGNNVNIFSSGLALKHILEKVNLGIGSYTSNLTVNGESSYAYGDYIPQEKDKIKINSK